MRKTLRFIIWSFGIIVILTILAITVISQFVTLNDFKPKISAKFLETTGRELILKGDIHWSLLPQPAIQINDVQLNNTAEFGSQPFAKIKKISAQIKLMPLLERRLEIKKLIINDIHATLIKNSKGTNNWDNFVKNQNPNTDSTKETKEKSNALPAVTFIISTTDINNGYITYLDQQGKHQAKINDLNIENSGLQLGSSIAELRSEGKLHIKSVTYDKFQIDNIKLAYQAKNGVAHIDPIEADMYQGNYRGNFVINLKNNSLTGTSELKEIQIEPLLQSATNKAMMTGTLNLKTNIATQGGYDIKNLTAKGQLQFSHLKVNKLNIDKLTAPYEMKNGILHITPISANLYQGTYQGNMDINLQNPTPQITGNAELKQIQMAPLLQDTANTPILTGTLNLKTNLQAQGFDFKNLNAQGTMHIDNGILKGIDISYWSDVAQALIKRKSPAGIPNANQTSFSAFKSNFSVSNGVANNDILIQSEKFTATGNGSTQLSTEQVNYTLNVKLHDITIPLSITGNFSNIQVQPKIESLIKNVVKDQLQNQLNQQIDKHLGKDIGNQLKNLNLDSLFNSK